MPQKEQTCECCNKPVTNRKKCVSCTISSTKNPAAHKEPNPQNAELDYLYVLKAIREVSMYKYFGMGRTLLTEFLKGNTSHKSIERNSLHQLKHFGSLAHADKELECIIDRLQLNGLIAQRPIERNSFSKVFELTRKGHNEIKSPSLYKKKLAFNFRAVKTEITKEDQKRFSNFGPFLSGYNPAQKKAIISENKHILCIAGAGSGKTTVLTKRIEFLLKHHRVNPKKILAITFTRKAKKEMESRLSIAGTLNLVNVETFNSFCEKMLRKHNTLFYGREVRVLSYKDRIRMVHHALANLDMHMDAALKIYFSAAQMRGKTPEQLAYIFINDCFFIRDHLKSKGKKIERNSFFSEAMDNTETTRLVFAVCKYIEGYMEKHGLRDFADQLIDAIALFKQHKELIPSFEHLLIDEYQDVNSTQIELIELLSSPNLFCVGDPRQSIFGWRGSDIMHILGFEDKYPNCEIITLTRNYRSTSHIVKLMNSSIKNMGLADIEPSIDGKNNMHLLNFATEKKESEFVIQSILAADSSQKIFVLARTNKQLNELSEQLEQSGIPHSVRSDEQKTQSSTKETNLTLATVHAIKGMEADLVFVIGCNSLNFPCKATEHPVRDMIKSDDYDKEEEERRLFYVALSRAKSQLYLTYAGAKPTHFVNPDMLELLEAGTTSSLSEAAPQLPPIKMPKGPTPTLSRLKEWRRSISRERAVPAYVVCTNRTLTELVQKAPASIAELHNVHGLGPARITSYGDDILKILNTQSAENTPTPPGASP